MTETNCRRNRFTQVKFTQTKSTAVIIIMAAAVVAQGTVINVSADELGSWADSASCKGNGVALHALVDMEKNLYRDCGTTLNLVCNNKDKSWKDGDVEYSCKSDISIEEITSCIVGQFGNSDSRRASFAKSYIGGLRSSVGYSHGHQNDENLKVVLKKYKGGSCGSAPETVGHCYDRGRRGKGGCHGGSEDIPGGEIPEPSTLAIFAAASLCFMVKRKKAGADNRC
ncbi:MAG: PEP-CTERM sorting domain-containing protein [Sedimentisphaerales bacterium]|nr:PEP-CTERM sorting domain-containing protein [Sedimentisphaerales bacterium]